MDMDPQIGKDSLQGKGSSPTRVGSIVHALAVLRHLSNSSESQGVTSIATQLQISPSSCFNILKTLVSEDVVEFDSRTKTYSIGYGLLNLVRQSLNRTSILPLITPGMRTLADRFSTAIGLWRLNRNDRPLLIWLAENEASTRIHLTIGQRLPPLAGAVGRCAAAYANRPKAEMARLFSNLRLHLPMTFEDYMGEIAVSRERGYAVDADCYMRGVTSVAAPVYGSDNALAYCLSATMFTGQYEDEELSVIGEELRALAERSTMRTHGVRAA